MNSRSGTWHVTQRDRQSLRLFRGPALTAQDVDQYIRERRWLSRN